MRARQESCGFTGHRPGKLPWGENEWDPRCLALKERIADAVESAYEQGYRHFLCGMALGCDVYFCECVQNLRARSPGITLEAVLPCPAQSRNWTPAQQRRYNRLLAECDLQTMVARQYTPDCMRRRDRYIVDHASLLIAAFAGIPGGTRYTVEYAMRRGIEVLDLHIELL